MASIRHFHYFAMCKEYVENVDMFCSCSCIWPQFSLQRTVQLSANPTGTVYDASLLLFLCTVGAVACRNYA